MSVWEKQIDAKNLKWWLFELAQTNLKYAKEIGPDCVPLPR